MKIGKISIALIAIVLVVILGFSFFPNKNVNLNVVSVAGLGVEENPQGTVFVSKQSPLMVSVLVNPQQIDSFVKFLPVNNESKKVMTGMEKLRTTLLTQAQLDSLNDIKDWIDDEVTFAVTSLDYDDDPENGTQPGYLLAVKNHDRNLASEFLQTYYTPEIVGDIEDAELTFEEYQGVNIIYRYPTTSQSKVRKLAAAVVGDFVLFANDLPVLTDAINSVQAVDLNLEHDLNYQNSIATLPQKKVGVVYFNLPNTSAWITNKPAIEDVVDTQSLTLTLQVDNHGILTHSALFTGQENSKETTLNRIPSTLKYVSDESVLTIAGIDLQQLGLDIETGVQEDNPFAQILSQMISPLESSLQLDLTENVFAKVKDEYALSLAVKEDKKSLDWFFISELGAETEELSPTFDELAQTRDLSIGNMPIEGDSMITWTKLITTNDDSLSRLEAEVRGVHGLVDNYEILTSSVNLLSNSLSRSPHSLLNTNSWKESIEALPEENNGYLHLKWKPLKPYLVKRFPLLRIVELGFKPLFDNLDSVTVTDEGVEEGIQLGSVYFNFD